MALKNINSRELKFRAWDGKEMTYSDENIRHEINDFKLSDLFEFYAKEEFMQSTNIIDKNEIEIFEGDILIDRETDDEGNDISGHYPVFYSKKLASYCIDNSYKKDGSSIVNLIDYLGIENLEVIGNIYENPELL